MGPRHQSETLQEHRDVLQPLLDDHRLAREVLSAMERRVIDERLDRPVAPGFWENVIAYFAGYFETVHHRFEDKHVFPVLEQCGFAASGSAARMMKQEHERMDPFLQHLRQAVAQGQPFELRATVQSFVALHRQHLDREEHNVFPLLRAAIARCQDRRLIENLEGLDTDAHGERERAEALADEIRRGAHG